MQELTIQTPLRLKYGVNAIIPIEYKMPSPCIAAPTDMMAHEPLEEGITQLNEVECLGPEEEI